LLTITITCICQSRSIEIEPSWSSDCDWRI